MARDGLAGDFKVDILVKKLNDISNLNLEPILENSCKIIEEEAIILIKSQGLGGTLANSLHHEVEGNTATVSSSAKYAIYVEFGTGIYAVNGDGRKSYWVWVEEPTGHEGEGKKFPFYETYDKALAAKNYILYKHPDWHVHVTNGQLPRPFLYPALYNSRDKILKQIKLDIKKELKL